jgi:DNA polymerase-1
MFFGGGSRLSEWYTERNKNRKVEKAMGKTLALLIDGHGLAFRAFYALPELNAPDGTPTNAIVGFLNMFQKILEEWTPSHVGIIFDAKGPTFRHEVYAAYKEGRTPTPPDFSRQLPFLKSILHASGYCVTALEGIEADDILAGTALRAASEGAEVLLVSADKDILQVLGNRIRVLRPKKGVSSFALFDEELFLREYGFSPDAMRDYLAMVGDAVDNVPGIPGVGDKTARKLLGQYGSLENIYSSLSELSPALKGRFLEHQDTAWRSRDLVTLSVKEALTLEELLPRSADEKELRDLCSRLGMERFSAKILAPRNASSGKELREAPFGHPAPKDEKTGEEKSGLKTRSLSGEVDNRASRTVSLDELFREDELAVHWFPENEDSSHGMCPTLFLASRDGRCWSGSPESGGFFTPLSEWAQKGTLLTLRYKTLCSILRGKVTLSPERVWDAETSLYLLHPDRASASLRDILKNQGVLTDAAPSAVTEALWRTRSIIQPQLEEFGLEQLQRSIDLPLCPVLVDMEQHGLGVHKTGFLELEMDLQRRIDVIEEELAQNAGTQINLNSPKQVGWLLFEKLGLPPLKKTKTGYSTDVSVLQMLASRPGGDVPSLLLEHRELSKMLTGFVHPFLKARDETTGCVHSTFEHVVTGTGRLSSTNPNVQNLPVFGEWAGRFRSALVPREKEHLFVAADYAQIELRILGHLAGEERLRTLFVEERDVHTETASWVFSVSPEDVTPELRRKAKVVNFGLLYGMSAFGLAERLAVGNGEAQELVRRYFHVFPGVREYMEETSREALRRGYTKTLFGRIRPLDEVSTVEGRGSGALKRVAINTPIQGTAADIAKLAMIRFYTLSMKNLPEATLVLQVHDSLVVETPAVAVQETEKVLLEAMEGAADLSVPLKAQPKRGSSMRDI